MAAIYRLDRTRTRRSEQRAARQAPGPVARPARIEAMAQQLNVLEELLESLLWQRNPLAAMRLQRR